MCQRMETVWQSPQTKVLTYESENRHCNNTKDRLRFGGFGLVRNFLVASFLPWK